MKKIIQGLFDKDDNADDFPKRIEAIEGELYVNVFRHEIEYYGIKQEKEGIAFLTEGLYSQGQKELFLVVVNHDESKDVLSESLGFFKTVYQLASQGRIVNLYATTTFKQVGLLGMMGVVYTEVPTYINISFPSPTLNMVLFSKSEISILDSYGTLRLLSMLGKQTRNYPHPYWVDLKREELKVDYVKEKTFLNNMEARASWVNSSVHLNTIENQITFQISKDFNESIQRELIFEAETAYITTSLYSKSDGCFTFSFDPEYREPEAIIPPNSQAELVSGCFLLLISGQEQYEGRILEDGLALLLTDAQWRIFWDSIIEKKEIYIESEVMNSCSFKLEWK